MRFIAGGPTIPDELLIARDKGDVIFFCGAGVSRAKALLPSFEGLGRDVLRILGAALDSPARRLLDKAVEMGQMAGVGGLLATDRVFGILEREFEVTDVRAAVAEALKPPSGYALDAHEILLDLATSRSGVTRLVTTNFDLLFEECDPSLPSSGPPRLPNPLSDHEFRGVVHLHGRVDVDYRRPQDEEFVVSSADFGRAYLTEGWATHFIRALLSRYQIVFVGYTADDPPVQYLLEALNLRSGSRSRLFAFQEGESGAAAALWEHKGVRAIPFDGADGYVALWGTLAAWAERARDVDGWHARLLEKAALGPASVDGFVRGQIAHVVSTREGSRRLLGDVTLDASWLLAFDPTQRYGAPDRAEPYEEKSGFFDPFSALGLDSEAAPEPASENDADVQRTIFNKRTMPADAWAAFAPNRFDAEEDGGSTLASIRGPASGGEKSLPQRLSNLGAWIVRVADCPITLWWAAQQTTLHPAIRRHLETSLFQEAQRFSQSILRGWRLLLAAWSDERAEPDMAVYEIQSIAKKEGWSQSLVRRNAALYRPRLKVKEAFGVPHPLLWTEDKSPDTIIHADVDYPRPYEGLDIPDEHLAYAVGQFRSNLELAISLEREVTGADTLHFETTRADDGGPELSDDSFGLTGPIVHFQKLMQRLSAIDPQGFRREVTAWPESDEYVFARLRIWAAGNSVLQGEDATRIFCGLPDVVFWGHVHERDLLYALRDRWAGLSDDARSRVESRLLNGSFPWPADLESRRDHAIARDRLSRLHWLHGEDLVFGFDYEAVMEGLKVSAPEWTTAYGDAAADSHAPVVFDVTRNENADALIEMPIAEILSSAKEASRYDYIGHQQREPFRGLSTRRPSRALGALTHAARQGEAPRWAWSEFLHADGRKNDSIRMIRLIARWLARVPVDQMDQVAHPVSEWMEATADKLYADASGELGLLWDRMVKCLAARKTEVRRHRRDRSWADDALNAPVGKLVNLLMKDPTTKGLAMEAGFPGRWTSRASQLLGLPGDLRPQALVMIAFQTVWLFNIDPLWTQRELLPSSRDAGDDGDAFWGGVLWAARLPSPKLFLELKPTLMARAIHPRSRRGHDTTLAGLLLAGWGGAPGNEPGALVTDVELREVLIHGDDDLRGQFVWQLGRWGSAQDGPWRARMIPFLENVWPKQRALRTPALSARLADLAFASGDLMPELVRTILPRLVPTRAALLGRMSADSEHYAPRKHPKATLDLLWAVLAEDPALWPYGADEALAELEQNAETSSDPRLSELRRRRER